MPDDYSRPGATEIEQTLSRPDYGIELDAYDPFISKLIARLEEPSELIFSGQDELPRLDGAVALVPIMSSFVNEAHPQYKTTVEWTIPWKDLVEHSSRRTNTP